MLKWSREGDRDVKWKNSFITLINSLKNVLKPYNETNISKFIISTILDLKRQNVDKLDTCLIKLNNMYHTLYPKIIRI